MPWTTHSRESFRNMQWSLFMITLSLWIQINDTNVIIDQISRLWRKK
jgi:hypothetical protein